VNPVHAMVAWPPGAGAHPGDPSFLADPGPVWAHLRARCPLTLIDQERRIWLPTRAADILTVAGDPRRFSSRAVTVEPFPAAEGDRSVLPLGLPPITVDPPDHAWTRRLLLPWLSQRRAAALAPQVRAHCAALLDACAGQHVIDAAEFAAAIPGVAVAAVLGLAPEHSSALSGWVADILGGAGSPNCRRAAMVALLSHLDTCLREARRRPRPGLLSALTVGRGDAAVPHGVALGVAALVVLAGIDTTASAIGAALWELARRPQQTAVVANQRAALVSAVEELLRVHAPVTMARLVVQPTVLAGRRLQVGDRVLLPFAAANRDPAFCPRADRVDLLAGTRLHLAFGSGPHRCAGVALARLQVFEAVQAWLQRYPSTTLEDPAAVCWSGGQVRGPKLLPLRVSGKLGA